MTDYYDESEGFATEDPWQQYQEAYDTNPVQTAAHLAQQYAAQYQPDPNAIAAQALAQMTELQRISEEQKKLDAETREIDLAFARTYGSDWEKYSPDVSHRLATNEEWQAKYNEARTAQDRANVLDEIYQQVKFDRDEDRLEWNKIKSANPKPYWAYMDDVFGGSK